jgi:hypothetical protein
VAATVPAGLRAHLGLRDALRPHQPSVEAAHRPGPGLPARPRPRGRCSRREGCQRWHDVWLRERRCAGTLRRSPDPVRAPCQHRGQDHVGRGRGDWAGPRGRGLHRCQHRQPPPLRGDRGRKAHRPGAVHAEPRGTAERQADRRDPTTGNHPRDPCGGRRDWVPAPRPWNAARRQPDQPATAHPSPDQNPLRRSSPQVSDALDPARRDRHGGKRARTEQQPQLGRSARPDAVHARDLGEHGRRRQRRRPRRHTQRR